MTHDPREHSTAPTADDALRDAIRQSGAFDGPSDVSTLGARVMADWRGAVAGPSIRSATRWSSGTRWIAATALGTFAFFAVVDRLLPVDSPAPAIGKVDVLSEMSIGGL